MSFNYLFVAQIEEWNLINDIFLFESRWHCVVWLWKEVLLWLLNWSNLDWVTVLTIIRIVINERLVLARLLGTAWGHVLVVWLPVDDLVVDHVGKVLKTVELDLMVTSVYDEWVIAGAASAR